MSTNETNVTTPETTPSPPTPLPRSSSNNNDTVEDGEAENEADAIIVDWDGPNDPQNPKNWSFGRKWAATAIVSAFTFISPVSSSMVAPATDVIASQFGITSEVLIAMTTSIFILAYAIGPLFLGPLSEIYGRSRVLQAANLFYLVWNLVCGFSQNTAQLIIFRFLAGLGGSAPLAVGGGVLGDVWHAEERGKAIAVYSLAPLMGPVVGPIAGAWIAQKSTWRWVFWSTSIVDAAIQVAGMFFLQETYAPLLLQRKAAKISQQLTGDSEKGGSPREVRTVYSKQEGRTWRELFTKSLARPFTLFWREPIAQVIGIYMAFVYGVFYIYLTNITVIFTTIYHESTGIAGLNYIGLGIGLTLASQINALYMDKIYVYLKNQNKKNGGTGEGEPEYRVPSMIIGSIVLPIGLLMTGWAAEKEVSWVVTDVGMAFVGAGIILTFQSMQTYVVDSFTLHAASALAAVSCLRALAGFGFPLFAPTMYNALGYGKGDTILAAFSIAVGWPAPILFWKYGKAIRMKSKHAKK
ncbi:MFS general substrate transporter [Rhodocollybia butyracea]|uniref:MFS general substrate transporter n=1 Tax=Rhodocollybia butyracea TaxID=206335 RepID=A0A9P5U4P0_9AGAR|nr:MFS general substrate transporter [Rhodocollybia butyracea]